VAGEHSLRFGGDIRFGGVVALTALEGIRGLVIGGHGAIVEGERQAALVRIACR
jgi:hypothetical protein